MPGSSAVVVPILTLLLAAPAPAQEPATARREAQASPFTPDTMLTPSGGPRVLFLRSPAPRVVAFRLSVPVDEAPGEVGAARLLGALALQRLRTLARPFGAQVDVARTPWGLAYSVAGPVAELELLGYLLREAVAEPDVRGATFEGVRRSLREEATHLTETPLATLVAELRALVSPGAPADVDAPAAIDALGPGTVQEVWRRSHRRAAMTLVVSASETWEVVLAAVHGLGLRDPAVAAPPRPVEPPRSARPGVQTLRVWHGRAYATTPGDDPRAAVAALLIASHLRDSPGDHETSVQLWEMAGHSVVAVLGAAYPQAAGSMRAAVEGALDDTSAGLDEASVREAAARVRSDLLVSARTPSGLVAAVGRALESGTSPRALEGRIDALRGLDARAIRSFLEALAAGPPLRAEVRP